MSAHCSPWPCGSLVAQSGCRRKTALYNTAKQKLLEGKQVFSFTQSTADLAGYCERAKHDDFTWFEMQHSTLEFKDIEAMIAACPRVAATPIIRLPDAQEWHIQHATDIGALGVMFRRWTMWTGRAKPRSGLGILRWGDGARGRDGSGHLAINGFGYYQTINDNMLVVIMIETPTGVANAFDIASVPGVDVVIMGNNDFTSFSGFRRRIGIRR